MRYVLLLSLASTFLYSAAQSLKIQELELVQILEGAKKQCCEIEIAIKDSFQEGLLAILNQPGSASFPFETLLAASDSLKSEFKILYAPDSTFRLISFLHHKGWDGGASHRDYRCYGQLLKTGAVFMLDCDTFSNNNWGKSSPYRIEKLSSEGPRGSYLIMSWSTNDRVEVAPPGQFISMVGLGIDNEKLTCQAIFPDSISSKYHLGNSCCMVLKFSMMEILHFNFDTGKSILELQHHGTIKKPLEKPDIIVKLVWKNGKFTFAD